MYINTLNDYLRKIYGCKVYKLSLEGGTTCPNRDGTLGTGGCIFCRGGSGDFAECGTDISEQLSKAKLRVKNKTKGGKYIAYFQSYSATYGDSDILYKKFLSAINDPSVVILSLATRPDCLGKDILEMLCELNAIKPVWVELGLQTIHESTAEFIRRGYDLDCYKAAVESLHKRNIKVITHMIIGLPFETKEMIYETAGYIGKIGSDGIKFHLLHVLSDTDLASLYEKGLIKMLSLEEYTEILAECIKRLPPTVVIHRMTGDGNKKYLIAPKWSANKRCVLNYINNEFRRINLIQGELL